MLYFFFSLYSVEMEIADRYSSSLKKMLTVERCECPLGYAGLSCEVSKLLFAFNMYENFSYKIYSL